MGFLFSREVKILEISVGLCGKALKIPDTYILEMRAHMNTHTGESDIFAPWKSDTDPSHGNYSWGLDSCGSPRY